MIIFKLLCVWELLEMEEFFFSLLYMIIEARLLATFHQTNKKKLQLYSIFKSTLKVAHSNHIMNIKENIINSCITEGTIVEVLDFTRW